MLKRRAVVLAAGALIGLMNLSAPRAETGQPPSTSSGAPESSAPADASPGGTEAKVAKAKRHASRVARRKGKATPTTTPEVAASAESQPAAGPASDVVAPETTSASPQPAPAQATQVADAPSPVVATPTEEPRGSRKARSRNAKARLRLRGTPDRTSDPQPGTGSPTPDPSAATSGPEALAYAPPVEPVAWPFSSAQRTASSPDPVPAQPGAAATPAVAATGGEALGSGETPERKGRRGSRSARAGAKLRGSLADPAAEPAPQAADAASPQATTTEVAVRSDDAGGPVQPVPDVDDPSAPGGGLRKLVAKLAVEYGVPFILADAVIRIESRYTAKVVHAGNYGLMQIRAQTARGMGYTGAAAGLLNPETNLRVGLKYLAEAYRLGHGDTCQTVMRYQSGLGATHFSSANRAYCARARSMSAGL